MKNAYKVVTMVVSILVAAVGAVFSFAVFPYNTPLWLGMWKQPLYLTGIFAFLVIGFFTLKEISNYKDSYDRMPPKWSIFVSFGFAIAGAAIMWTVALINDSSEVSTQIGYIGMGFWSGGLALLLMTGVLTIFAVVPTWIKKLFGKRNDETTKI